MIRDTSTSKEQAMQNALQAILNAGHFSNNGDFVIPRFEGAIICVERAQAAIEKVVKP